jgi:hypothetical protein
MLVTASLSQHPGPVSHRWLMTDVLPVATGKVGHPIAMLVQMISNNPLVHVKRLADQWSRPSVRRLQSLKGLFGPLIGWKKTPAA